MAVLALISPTITISGVNMSQYVTMAALNVEAVELDTTNFGSGGWQQFIAGLKKGEAKVAFNDDFAATTVDDRLWAWFIGGVPVTFNIKATTAANSTTNPEYQTSVLVSKFTPLEGKVGDLANQSLTWKTSGAVVRATS
jgi:hypothetical protein